MAIKNIFQDLYWNCKIWGFQGGDYEECRLLGCGAVWILCKPTFLRNVGLHKIHTAPHPRRRHSLCWNWLATTWINFLVGKQLLPVGERFSLCTPGPDQLPFFCPLVSCELFRVPSYGRMDLKTHPFTAEYINARNFSLKYAFTKCYLVA
jgi:hypothetical protein